MACMGVTTPCTVPPQVVVLYTMNMCNTSPTCAMLTELRDHNGIKVIADYVGLPSTSEETKVLAPLMYPQLQTRP